VAVGAVLGWDLGDAAVGIRLELHHETIRTCIRVVGNGPPLREGVTARDARFLVNCASVWSSGSLMGAVGWRRGLCLRR
jgi:hypothetical protein